MSVLTKFNNSDTNTIFTFNNEDFMPLAVNAEYAPENMGQVALDFLRGIKKIYINGKSLESIIDEQTENSDKIADVLNTLTENEQIKIYRLALDNSLFSKFSPEENKLFHNFFMRFIHQGGLLSALQTELCDRSRTDENTPLPQRCVKSIINFSCKDNKCMIMTEEVKVTNLFYNNNNDEIINDENAADYPDSLFTGVASYQISINNQNQCQAKLINVTAVSHHDYATELFLSKKLHARRINTIVTTLLFTGLCLIVAGIAMIAPPVGLSLSILLGAYFVAPYMSRAIGRLFNNKMKFSKIADGLKNSEEQHTNFDENSKKMALSTVAKQPLTMAHNDTAHSIPELTPTRPPSPLSTDHSLNN